MNLWITNECTDPAWNLAAEEYLLTMRKETVAMLWQNSRSVIIGKNQDLEAEVDTAAAAGLGIPVIRRLTGGGAVFHDLGNVNYTYMFTFEGRHEMSFEPFARVLTSALGRMGVKAELSGRNDILVDGRKVSGCAHTCVGSRALYHGTLLFSADLSVMEGLLRYSEEKYRGKGIPSVSSRVGNLSDWIKDMDVNAFMSRLSDILSANCERYVFTEEDATVITDLREHKYIDPNWFETR
ncbi:MAG: lipoate--protein ligase family protein [Oscillospiraceae bacterium]|nr:lipoate--protein ligase family protein [Oscillospiraceae bacterium]